MAATFPTQERRALPFIGGTDVRLAHQGYQGNQPGAGPSLQVVTD